MQLLLVPQWWPPLLRDAYIVLGCKLSEFFNGNILNLKFIPGRLLGLPRDHELHVILIEDNTTEG